MGGCLTQGKMNPTEVSSPDPHQLKEDNTVCHLLSRGSEVWFIMKVTLALSDMNLVYLFLDKDT